MYKLGHKMSEETKIKLSIAHSGKVLSIEHKEKLRQAKLKNPVRYWLGKKNPHITGGNNCMKKAEVREKISKANSGRKFSNETREKMSLAHKGIKLSAEHLKRRIEGQTGSGNPRWIEDRTQLKKSDRNGKSSACNNWRKEVYLRNSWKCKINNKECFGSINAHHISNWKDFPQSRYEVKNGITFCHFHHNEFHKKYGKRKNTIEQLEDFLINKHHGRHRNK